MVPDSILANVASTNMTNHLQGSKNSASEPVVLTSIVMCSPFILSAKLDLNAANKNTPGSVLTLVTESELLTGRWSIKPAATRRFPLAHSGITGIARILSHATHTKAGKELVEDDAWTKTLGTMVLPLVERITRRDSASCGSTGGSRLDQPVMVHSSSDNGADTLDQMTTHSHMCAFMSNVSAIASSSWQQGSFIQPESESRNPRNAFMGDSSLLASMEAYCSVSALPLVSSAGHSSLLCKITHNISPYAGSAPDRTPSSDADILDASSHNTVTCSARGMRHHHRARIIPGEYPIASPQQEYPTLSDQSQPLNRNLIPEQPPLTYTLEWQLAYPTSSPHDTDGPIAAPRWEYPPMSAITGCHSQTTISRVHSFASRHCQVADSSTRTVTGLVQISQYAVAASWSRAASLGVIATNVHHSVGLQV
jgi:hypothetical protein